MKGRPALGYSPAMVIARHRMEGCASTPSRRTLHVELLRLCARIGYSPPASAS